MLINQYNTFLDAFTKTHNLKYTDLCPKSWGQLKSLGPCVCVIFCQGQNSTTCASSLQTHMTRLPQTGNPKAFYPQPEAACSQVSYIQTTESL